MALPYSGQISMGDINVELGRTRTTANSSLAGGSTPISTSLFGLATGSINKTQPHSISEFWGYTQPPAVKTLYWTFNTFTCTGDYFQIFLNSDLMVNASASAVGDFTVVGGDYIEVYIASGIKGVNCADGSVLISEDGNEITSVFAPGYSEVGYVDFYIYSGAINYNVNGYMGIMPT